MTEENPAPPVCPDLFYLFVLDFYRLVELTGNPEVVIEHCHIPVMYLPEMKPGVLYLLTANGTDAPDLPVSRLFFKGPGIKRVHEGTPRSC